MPTARKIIALILIVFIGVPLLFGIIWVVGTVRASVSAEFISDLPRDIIADLPGKAEEIFRDAQDERIIRNANIRTWFQAAAKTGISPRQLMEKTGLQEWLRGELSNSLNQIGQVLRGDLRSRPISIDLRPLKEALLHPEVDRFLAETLNNLPPCDEDGRKAWRDVAETGSVHHEIPACRPDDAASKDALLNARTRAARDMDNELVVFNDVRSFPHLPFGISGTLTFFSYALFLIPAVIVLLAAVIAAPSTGGVLRWSGLSVLAGSLPALFLALIIKYFSLWALKSAPFTWYDGWTSEFGDLVLDKLRWIPMRVIDQLFSPVVAVAAIVGVVGIVLYALSISARHNAGKGPQPASQATAPPAKTEIAEGSPKS